MKTTTCLLLVVLAAAVVCVATGEEELDASVLRVLLQDEQDISAPAPAPEGLPADGPDSEDPDAFGPEAEMDDDLDDPQNSGTHGQASLFLLATCFVAAFGTLV